MVNNSAFHMMPSVSFQVCVFEFWFNNKFSQKNARSIMNVPNYPTYLTSDSVEVKGMFNPLTTDIKKQILLSCSHTFLIKVLGRSYENIKKIWVIIRVIILNSHDLRG